jgi:hypothetical protein
VVAAVPRSAMPRCLQLVDLGLLFGQQVAGELADLSHAAVTASRAASRPPARSHAVITLTKAGSSAAPLSGDSRARSPRRGVLSRWGCGRGGRAALGQPPQSRATCAWPRRRMRTASRANSGRWPPRHSPTCADRRPGRPSRPGRWSPPGQGRRQRRRALHGPARGADIVEVQASHVVMVCPSRRR